MGLIEDFVARYRKEYDFYDQAARLVAQALETSLQAAGIRAMVTSRAKSVQRLESKCRQRAGTKNYSTVDDIYRDIVDLAGVRVALYFPAERIQADKLVRQLFHIAEPAKNFPAPSEATITYTKRFSGYWATHYRVQLKDTDVRAHRGAPCSARDARGHGLLLDAVDSPRATCSRSSTGVRGKAPGHAHESSSRATWIGP